MPLWLKDKLLYATWNSNIKNTVDKEMGLAVDAAAPNIENMMLSCLQHQRISTFRQLFSRD